MSEKPPLHRRDQPPEEGLFSLEYLYVIQDEDFRMDHALFLERELELYKRSYSLAALERRRRAGKSDPGHDSGYYQEWYERYGSEMSDEMLEGIERRSPYFLMHLLGHLALSTCRREDLILNTVGPPRSPRW